jgi:tetratricopeptide (TPR) repeat protein
MSVAELMIDQGLLDDARPLLDDALATFTAARHWYRWYVVRSMGLLEARAGTHDDAARLLGEARDGFEELKAVDEVVHTDIVRAEAALLRGEPAKALQLLGDLDSASHPLAARATRLAATASVHLGRIEEARVTLTHALAVATELGDAFEHAVAASLLAELKGDAKEARRVRRTLTAMGVVTWPTLRAAA